eukprot:GHVS01095417.1.p1 GENE.GHVS01095417.1~~GHVS01095417.1.p1  ORF type:complete len:1526 (-),score=281.47 GHVS01095417.1:720-5297(-)
MAEPDVLSDFTSTLAQPSVSPVELKGALMTLYGQLQDAKADREALSSEAEMLRGSLQSLQDVHQEEIDSRDAYIQSMETFKKSTLLELHGQLQATEKERQEALGEVELLKSNIETLQEVHQQEVHCRDAQIEAMETEERAAGMGQTDNTRQAEVESLRAKMEELTQWHDEAEAVHQMTEADMMKEVARLSAALEHEKQGHVETVQHATREIESQRTQLAEFEAKRQASDTSHKDEAQHLAAELALVRTVVDERALQIERLEELSRKEKASLAEALESSRKAECASDDRRASEAARAATAARAMQVKEAEAWSDRSRLQGELEAATSALERERTDNTECQAVLSRLRSQFQHAAHGLATSEGQAAARSEEVEGLKERLRVALEEKHEVQRGREREIATALTERQRLTADHATAVEVLRRRLADVEHEARRTSSDLEYAQESLRAKTEHLSQLERSFAETRSSTQVELAAKEIELEARRVNLRAVEEEKEGLMLDHKKSLENMQAEMAGLASALEETEEDRGAEKRRATEREAALRATEAATEVERRSREEVGVLAESQAKELEALRLLLASATAENASLHQTHQEILGAERSRTQAAENAKTEAYHQFKTGMANAEAQLRHVGDDLTGCRQTLQHKEECLQSMTRRAEMLQESLYEQKEHGAASEVSQRVIDEEVKRITAKLQMSRRENSEHKARIDELKDGADALREAARAAEYLATARTERLEALQREKDQLNDERLVAIQNQQKQTEDIEDERSRWREQLDTVESRMGQMQADIHRLHGELSVSNVSLSDSLELISQLEECKATATAFAEQEMQTRDERIGALETSMAEAAAQYAALKEANEEQIGGLERRRDWLAKDLQAAHEELEQSKALLQQQTQEMAQEMARNLLLENISPSNATTAKSEAHFGSGRSMSQTEVEAVPTVAEASPIMALQSLGLISDCCHEGQKKAAESCVGTQLSLRDVLAKTWQVLVEEVERRMALTDETWLGHMPGCLAHTRPGHFDRDRAGPSFGQACFFKLHNTSLFLDLAESSNNACILKVCRNSRGIFQITAPLVDSPCWGTSPYGRSPLSPVGNHNCSDDGTDMSLLSGVGGCLLQYKGPNAKYKNHQAAYLPLNVYEASELPPPPSPSSRKSRDTFPLLHQFVLLTAPQQTRQQPHEGPPILPAVKQWRDRFLRMCGFPTTATHILDHEPSNQFPDHELFDFIVCGSSPEGGLLVHIQHVTSRLYAHVPLPSSPCPMDNAHLSTRSTNVPSHGCVTSEMMTSTSDCQLPDHPETGKYLYQHIREVSLALGMGAPPPPPLEAAEADLYDDSTPPQHQQSSHSSDVASSPQHGLPDDARESTADTPTTTTETGVTYNIYTGPNSPRSCETTAGETRCESEMPASAGVGPRKRSGGIGVTMVSTRSDASVFEVMSPKQLLCSEALVLARRLIWQRLLHKSGGEKSDNLDVGGGGHLERCDSRESSRQNIWESDKSVCPSNSSWKKSSTPRGGYDAELRQHYVGVETGECDWVMVPLAMRTTNQ